MNNTAVTTQRLRPVHDAATDARIADAIAKMTASYERANKRTLAKLQRLGFETVEAARMSGNRRVQGILLGYTADPAAAARFYVGAYAHTFRTLEPVAG